MVEEEAPRAGPLGPSRSRSKKLTTPSGRPSYSKTRSAGVGSVLHPLPPGPVLVGGDLVLVDADLAVGRLVAPLAHGVEVAILGRAQHGDPPRVGTGAVGVRPNGSLPAMSAVSREQLRALMGEVLEAQGKSLPDDESADLQTIGFRSLDFSELALRVEDEIDEELNFDAAGPAPDHHRRRRPRPAHRDPGPVTRRGTRAAGRGPTPWSTPAPASRRPGRSCRTVELPGPGGRGRSLLVRRAARRAGARRAPARSCWSSPRGRIEQNLRAELLDAGFNLVEGDEVERAGDAARAARTDRLWLLTSGSTGRPKRIGHTLAVADHGLRRPWRPRRWLCPYSPGTYAWWQVVTLGLGSPGQDLVVVDPAELDGWVAGRASSTASPPPRARRPSGGRRS